MPLNTNKTRALLFDVFGTCVDWRTTVTQALHTQARATLNDPTASLATAVRMRASSMTVADWATFAQAWRDAYKTFVRTLASPEHAASAAFKTVDDHHLDSLRQLLRQFALDGLWTAAQTRNLALVWHYLAAWPDAASGIASLNSLQVNTTPAGDAVMLATGTLSNGNRELLRHLRAHARLPFSLRGFSAEDFAAYKPSPRVYLGAAEALRLRPDQCVLVAAHLGDLRAARDCGFQTVYVAREGEEDWSEEQVDEARREGWVDLWVELGRGGFGAVAEEVRRGLDGEEVGEGEGLQSGDGERGRAREDEVILVVEDE